MNIAQAMELISYGRFARRAKWPGITYIYLEGSVIMYSHLGIDSPWSPTHQDLLVLDWEETIPDR